MADLHFDNFIVLLAQEIDELTSHFVFDGYHALAGMLKAPLGSMLVLYIVLTGYAIARGLIQRPQQELLKFSIKAGLIYTAGLNWDWFSLHVRDLFIVGSESVASTLMQALQKTSGDSINQSLQNVLNETVKLGMTLFEAASLRKLAPYYAGIMVFLSGTLTIGFAFIEIVIAKLMLGITLCTAPLFIAFTLFEQTKSFFDRWLGVLTGFAFVLIFVSSVVGLSAHLLHWVTLSFTTSTDALTAAVWVPIFMVACLCVMGIMEAVSIGKSIGGSFSSSSGSAMMAGFIRGSSAASKLSKNTLVVTKVANIAAKNINKLRGGHNE